MALTCHFQMSEVNCHKVSYLKKIHIFNCVCISCDNSKLTIILSLDQYHVRHQLILRDIEFLPRLLQSTNSIVRQCIMNASSNTNILIGFSVETKRRIMNDFMGT